MIGILIKTINPTLIKQHTRIVMLVWILCIFGPIAGIMFGIFLITGSYTIIDLGLSIRNALLIDALLSIIYFLQHSIVIRKEFKKWLGKFMSDVFHNAFYGITSIITLMLVLIFWQKTPAVIARAEGIVFLLICASFCFCVAGLLWGILSLRSFDALGVKPLMFYISNKQERPQQVVAKGPYRWVRHPLYFFLIILIWSYPVLTPDRLLFNVMWSIWIVIGTYLEDRDLHREFGIQYSTYSSQVPMLIPYRIPKLKG